ncbi:MAG: M28 family metallopeptidase [Candidatus Binatia bacterium]
MRRFDPYPGIEAHIDRLRARARLGAVAYGEIPRAEIETSQASQALGKLEKRLIVTAIGLQDPFGVALEAAGATESPERCTFVSSIPERRVDALKGGLRVVPHPRLADVTPDSPIVHLRIVARSAVVRSSWSEVLRNLPIVPILLEDRGSDRILYGVGAPTLLRARLDSRDFSIEPLWEESELPILRVYRTWKGSSFDELIDSRHEDGVVRYSSGETLLIGRSQSTGCEALRSSATCFGDAALLDPDEGLLGTDHPIEIPRYALTQDEIDHFRTLTPRRLEENWRPYCQPDDTVSRHIRHAGNAAVIGRLVEDLRASCADAGPTAFTYDGDLTLCNIGGSIAGTDLAHESIVICAHLDSTASNTVDYSQHAHDWSAPGADDNASGVAAVLAAASVLKELASRRRPRRTIRFLLFNAEESYMFGSSSYLRTVSGSMAAFNLDMIGWMPPERKPPYLFEVHLPAKDLHLSEEITKSCRRMADLVISAAARVSPCLKPEIYPPPGLVTSPVRSDHRSFLVDRRPACHVCEDSYEPDSFKERRYPQYHTRCDVFDRMNPTYAADITRAVAAAAWCAAKMEVRVMPHKELIVSFILDVIRDGNLRCDFLAKEETTMRAYGLDPYQIDLIKRQDRNEILRKMIDEIIELGLDERWRAPLVGGPTPPPLCVSPSGSEVMMFESSYAEGKIHTYCVLPTTIAADSEAPIVLVGRGYMSQPFVQFRLDGVNREARASAVTCDLDMYQRAHLITPRLTPGQWVIRLRNAVTDDYDSVNAEKVSLNVV